MFQVHLERPWNGKIWEMVPIGEITVNKSLNEPSSLSCTFLRDKMTAEIDDIVAVQLNEEGMDDFNLFYGWIRKTSKFTDEVQVTAYDQLMSFKLCKEIKVYGDRKASELFTQICEEHNYFMLDPPNVVDTEYKIPGCVCDNQTQLDMMVDVLNISNERTGKNFYMYDFFKNLCIGESELHKIPKEEYEFNVENIKSYTFDEDGTQRINEVVVKKDDGSDDVLAVRRDEGNIKSHGVISLHVKSNDGENAEKIAADLLYQNQQIATDISVSVYGCNPQVYPGRKVHLDLFTGKLEYIMGWFIVQSVTYKLKDGVGDMDVKLKLAEMESEAWL